MSSRFSVPKKLSTTALSQHLPRPLKLQPPPNMNDTLPCAHPGGNATISTVRHISLRVPQPGRTGAVSALVS